MSTPINHAAVEARLAKSARDLRRARRLYASGREADRRRALELWVSVRDRTRALIAELENASPALRALAAALGRSSTLH